MVNTSPLYIPSGSGSVGNSRATLTVDGELSTCCSQELGDSEEEEDDDDDEDEGMPRRLPPPPPPHRQHLPLDNKRLLAALARSPLRETRSLDPFPAAPRKPRRNSRSLENCMGPASTHGSSASLVRLRAREDGRAGGGAGGGGARGSSEGVRSSPVPNGDARPAHDSGGGGGGGGGGSSAEDVQAPLLLPAAQGKRWRSLEEVAPGEAAAAARALPSNGFGKKALARGSIRSWLVGLFQGNGLRAADSPALRNGLGYSDLQSESIV